MGHHATRYDRFPAMLLISDAPQASLDPVNAAGGKRWWAVDQAVAMLERGGQLANEHGGQQHTFLYVGHCRMSAINAGDEPVLPPGFRWDRPWQGAMGPPTALFLVREEVGRLVQKLTREWRATVGAAGPNLCALCRA